MILELHTIVRLDCSGPRTRWEAIHVVVAGPHKTRTTAYERIERLHVKSFTGKQRSFHLCTERVVSDGTVGGTNAVTGHKDWYRIAVEGAPDGAYRFRTSHVFGDPGICPQFTWWDVLDGRKNISLKIANTS